VDYYDYWVLDVDRREWRQQPIFGSGGMFDFNKELRRNVENFYYGMTDYENDLAWYTERSSLGANDLRLMVFDLEKGFGAYTPLSLGDLGFKSSVLWYNIDKEKNQLLYYWIEHVSFDKTRSPIRVSALQLPHPDSTRAMMNLIREYGSIHPPAKASYSWAWLWVLLPLGLGSAMDQQLSAQFIVTEDYGTRSTTSFWLQQEPGEKDLAGSWEEISFDPSGREVGRQTATFSYAAAPQGSGA
jgi:hypothetical protein